MSRLGTIEVGRGQMTKGFEHSLKEFGPCPIGSGGTLGILHGGGREVVKLRLYVMALQKQNRLWPGGHGIRRRVVIRLLQ